MTWLEGNAYVPIRRLRSAIGPAAALTAAFVLVACSAGAGGSGSPAASVAAPSGGAASAAAGSGLQGTLWRLSEYLGPDGTALPVPEAVSASATFADGSVAGNA